MSDSGGFVLKRNDDAARRDLITRLRHLGRWQVVRDVKPVLSDTLQALLADVHVRRAQQATQA